MGALCYFRMSGLYLSTEEQYILSIWNQSIFSFWTEFLMSLIISNPVFTRPPISLCLASSSQSKNPFYDPPTQTLCEELLCLN
jgi:hypothetical protein